MLVFRPVLVYIYKRLSGEKKYEKNTNDIDMFDDVLHIKRQGPIC